MTAENKGYCSRLVTGAAPFDMEFNLDETCSVPGIFDSLPGTHKWMLYRDIVKGDLVISCGTFLSVTSIRTDKRIICCQESVGPSGVLFKTPPQLYKIHRDFSECYQLIIHLLFLLTRCNTFPILNNVLRQHHSTRE